jgi:spore coat polysaccharide biosynthesis protein SpsF
MTHPHTIAIIQARMSSSRLPGKVLLDIARQPMLAWVIERTRRARSVDQVVVATTVEPADNPIAEFCTQRGYPYSRGSLHDVLDRYFQAARSFGAEMIVRITADCPLIDPGVIDQTVEAFRGKVDEAGGIRVSEFGVQNYEPGNANSDLHPLTPNLPLATPYDFAANRLPPPWGRTFPIGLDTEVCTFQALETAWKEADQPHQREHVMPFFYDHPERFRMLLVNYAPELVSSHDYGALRWTVDTAEDLELVRQIAARFPNRHDFTWLEVLETLLREPELAHINAQVKHKHYLQVDERHES